MSSIHNLLYQLALRFIQSFRRKRTKQSESNNSLPSRTFERLETRVVFAGVPQMLLEQGFLPESIDQYTEVNGTTYFVASTLQSGRELWKLDSQSPTGATLVRDIRPGAASSSPTNLVSFAGSLYFTADDGVNGVELWKINATGPALVSDINPGGLSSLPDHLTEVSGFLYFSADDGSNGTELWRINGTQPEPEMVANIHPTEGSNPYELTNVDGVLYFSADNGINGIELWKSDGTSEGTELVADINVLGTDVSLSSQPTELTNVNGTLFFLASTSSQGQELWKSDGTAAGTTLVTEINHGPANTYAARLTEVGGILFFTADSLNSGSELWKSDGTATGTQMVADIVPFDSGSFPEDLMNIGGTLYFTANDQIHGRELWKSDGTQEGTTLVKDISAGPSSAYPESITNVNGTLFFGAFDQDNGFELWKSDGTESGTVFVKDLLPGRDSAYPYQLYNAQGTLIFSAVGYAEVEVWASDGSEAGTNKITDVGFASDAGSDPGQFTQVGDTVFFVANTLHRGAELWKTDGTAAGTVLVKDINPSPRGSSYPANLLNFNGVLYFTADDGQNGPELWKSDGTEAGTVMVKDIHPGIDANISNLTFGSTIRFFFTADDGEHGIELWRSDGTEAGTVMVSDFNEGPEGSDPSDLTMFNLRLYFAATGSTGDRELQEHFSTSITTRNLNTLGSSNPGQLVSTGSRLFFAADNGLNGRELWEIPRNELPRLLADVNPGLNSSNPESIVEVSTNDHFFIAENDGEDGVGREVFRISQTPNSSTFISSENIRPGSLGSDPEFLSLVGESFVVSADNGESGRELYVSFRGGGFELIDINPLSGSNPSNFTTVGRALYFTADDGTHGTELWRFNRTNGRQQILDFTNISPDSTSNPRNLKNVGGRLFFSADNGVAGRELWMIPKNDAPTDLAISNNLVSQNAEAGTVIGTFSSTDPNSTDTHEYFLNFGVGDASKFTIVGNELRAKVTLDFAAGPTYSIGVQTVDDGGLSFTKQIQIGRLNQAPTNLMLSNTSVAGNAPAGTVVGQLSTTDIDVGDTHIYSLVSGVGDGDNAKFTIVGNELRAAAILDFATGSAYSVRIRTTDAGGLFVEKTFEISRLNQAPTNLTLSNTSVADNSPAGTVVGQLTTTDADANDTHTYSLVTGEGDDDNAKFTIVGNELRAAATLDFAEFPDYMVRIRTTDAAGGTFEKAFVIVQASANPVANNDFGTVVNRNDYTVTVPVIQNDLQTSGASVEIVTPPAQSAGTVTIVDNAILFDPTPGFTGTVVFTYQLRVSQSIVSNTANVSVGVSGSNWQNPVFFLDVDSNTIITASDALLIINLLNDPNSSRIVVISPIFTTGPFLDVNGDGLISPSDALLVINMLNSRSDSGGGEGEAQGVRVQPTNSMAASSPSAIAAPGGQVPGIEEDSILGRRRRGRG